MVYSSTDTGKEVVVATTPGKGGTTPGGSFRINNEADLKKAISAAGSVAGGESEKVRVRKLIMRKAKAMGKAGMIRSDEHTSELQSLMRNSYAVFCLKKNK